MTHSSFSKLVALFAVVLASASQMAAAEEGNSKVQMPRSGIEKRALPVGRLHSRRGGDRMSYVRRAAFNRKVNFGFEPTAYPESLEKDYADPAKRDAIAWDLEYGRRWDRRKSGMTVAKVIHEAKPGSTLEPLPWGGRFAKITTADGKEYVVGRDPRVMEVQTPKARLHQVKQTLRSVYDGFAKAEIRPGTQGGGHIHVDNALFKENPLLLRNVLVDMYNNGLLKLVMRPGDKSSAKSMWQRGEGQAFEKAIQAIDEQARANGGKYSIEQMMKGVETFYKPADGRYRDVNLQNFYSGHDGRQPVPTVEFRFFEPQKSAQEAYLVTKLMSRYLGGLAAVKRPLAVAGAAEVDAWYKGVNAEKNFNYKAVEKQWRRFVHKLDLNYKDYKPFVEQWRVEPTPAPKPSAPTETFAPLLDSTAASTPPAPAARPMGLLGRLTQLITGHRSH